MKKQRLEAKNGKQFFHTALYCMPTLCMVVCLKMNRPINYPFPQNQVQVKEIGVFSAHSMNHFSLLRFKKIRVTSCSQRKLLYKLCSRLNFEISEEWYKMKTKNLQSSKEIMNHFKQSPIRAFTTLVPELEWQPWLFSNIPNISWHSKSIILSYLQHVKENLNITCSSQWYTITARKIYELKGTALVKQFGSLYSLLQYSYPEYSWHAWQFNVVPHGFWNEFLHHRLYLDWFSNEECFTTPMMWYDVTFDRFVKKNGKGLLKRYSNSPSRLIINTLPEFWWITWKFNSMDSRSWEDIKFQTLFFRGLGDDLMIDSMEDWYQVTEEQVKQRGGYKILKQYHSLPKTLQHVYPNHKVSM